MRRLKAKDKWKKQELEVIAEEIQREGGQVTLEEVQRIYRERYE